jgi:phage terminase large subunit-like protein
MHNEVSVEQQAAIQKLLRKFEQKEVKALKDNPKDLAYAIKLIEHYQNLQDTGGHLVKLFQPGPLSIEHYPRHKAFFDATRTHKEVLFRAANRCGKSESGAYTVSCWATGLYPDWWEGRVFDKATYGWVVGDTNDTVRTILQDKLLGTPQGTGLIPKELIEDVVVRPNTGGTVDMIYVRHKPTGKISRIKFKTYQSGPDSFYGAAPDYVWMDEEPSGKDAQLIWNQCYIRLLTTNGSLLITFTPLMGWTPLVKNFSETAEDLTPSDD